MSRNVSSNFRTTVTGLLPRLRQSLPLPIAPEEIYRAAFPESKIADWCLAPVETDFRNKALPYRNLVKCTHRTGTVHFCLNTEAELDEMTDDSDRALFWVTFPHPVVGPVDLGALLLGQTARSNQALVDWYNAATLLDEDISEMTERVYGECVGFTNSTEIALAWPEVVTAVPGILPASAKLRIAARSPRITRLRKSIEQAFPPAKMEKLTNMLATAIMLPPNPQLRAWVGLFDPFSEDHTP